MPEYNLETDRDLWRDPQASAHAGGLCYVQDRGVGIRRLRCGRGFRYLSPEGTPVADSATLQRIRSLAIPPAWTEVWICPSPLGHLQSTGRDGRGRKQYLYHPGWGVVRNEAKFSHILQFADVLPQLRRQVDSDLRRRGLPQPRAVATVVRLLERSLIRIGNEEYLKENKSFGLTTLRRRHIEIGTEEIRFAFRGKSGVWHEKSVRDRRVARVIRQMLDLPGQELFQYLDEEGKPGSVTSDDVNAYLREATGADFTAKDIRTWHATVQSACELRQAGPFQTVGEGKKKLNQVIRLVAALLGNRPAACRKYYIHPDILDSYLQGLLLPSLEAIAERLDDSFPAELDAFEHAVKIFLQWRQRQAATAATSLSEGAFPI